jgi:hypothetical protein
VRCHKLGRGHKQAKKRYQENIKTGEADTMSTLIEIGIGIAAFGAILAARRRDWVTFAVSLLAVLIIAGLTIMNIREREH